MAGFKEPNYERDIEKYIKEYKRAMEEITERVLTLSDMSTIDNQQVNSLLSQITFILGDLSEKTDEWVVEHISKAFDEGRAGTILALGLSAESQSEALIGGAMSMLQRNTLDALIADTFEDLLYATQNTSRKVKKIVRDTVSERMRINTAQQLGRRTQTKDIVERLSKQGLSRRLKKDGWVGIVDKANRRWNLTTYAEMVVRTKMQQSYVEGVRSEALERGVDLAIISSHGATDPCSNHEGAIISMNGTTKGYPSYAELRGSDEIFHPNCKHTISPLRSPDLLPEDVYKKAEAQTKNSAKRMGIDYEGLKAPTTGKTKIVGTDKRKTDNEVELKFVPAKNIKEANRWALMNLDIKEVNYKDYHIDLANSTNQTLEIMQKRFPEVRDTKFVGTAQLRNKRLYEQQLDENFAFWKRAGIGEKRAWEKAKKSTKRRKVSGRTYASSTNSAWGDLEGICFNKKWAKDMDKLKASVANDVKTNWHPVGTEDPASIMTHEYGHQIDNFLKKHNVRDGIDNLWRKYDIDEIKNGLSRYGSKNSAEFFAEAFAELIHNPEPRQIAREVGEELDKAFKRYRSKSKYNK